MVIMYYVNTYVHGYMVIFYLLVYGTYICIHTYVQVKYIYVHTDGICTYNTPIYIQYIAAFCVHNYIAIPMYVIMSLHIM